MAVAFFGVTARLLTSNIARLFWTPRLEPAKAEDRRHPCNLSTKVKGHYWVDAAVLRHQLLPVETMPRLLNGDKATQ